MPQSFRSLCFGFLEPLAHCALAYSEGCGDVFLFPSLFMQFPGTHPSSFAPIFGECRFLAHPSFYRHSTFFLYFSPLRSMIATIENLQRVITYGGANITVADLVHRYQARLNHLRQLDAPVAAAE